MKTMCSCVLHTQSHIRISSYWMSGDKNEEHIEESYSTKHSSHNADHPSGFSAISRSRNILRHQRNEHKSTRRKPAVNKATRLVQRKQQSAQAALVVVNTGGRDVVLRQNRNPRTSITHGQISSTMSQRHQSQLILTYLTPSVLTALPQHQPTPRNYSEVGLHNDTLRHKPRQHLSQRRRSDSSHKHIQFTSHLLQRNQRRSSLDLATPLFSFSLSFFTFSGGSFVMCSFLDTHKLSYSFNGTKRVRKRTG